MLKGNKRRQKLKEDENAYANNLENDRLRKKNKRESMDPAELVESRAAQRIAAKKWRQNQTIDKPATKIKPLMAYANYATFSKAKKNALPRSPRKQAAVLGYLAHHQVLGIDVAARNESPRALSDENIHLIQEFYELDSISRVMPG